MLSRRVVDRVYTIRSEVLPPASFIEFFFLGDQTVGAQDLDEYPEGWDFYGPAMQFAIDFLMTGYWTGPIPIEPVEREKWNVWMNQVADYLGLPIETEILEYPADYVFRKFEHEWYRTYRNHPELTKTWVPQLLEVSESFCQTLCSQNALRSYCAKSSVNYPTARLLRRQHLDKALGFYAQYVREYDTNTYHSRLYSSLDRVVTNFREKLCKKFFVVDLEELESIYVELTSSKLPKNPTSNASESDHLRWMQELLLDAFFKAGCFVAGGSVFDALSGFDEFKDIDVFLHGVSESRAKRIIELLAQAMLTTYIQVSGNSVTIANGSKRNVQVILRLYLDPEEVLRGFDLDLSAIGFNGKFVMTPLAEYALQTRTLFVSHTRLSYSYEYRLFKYVTRKECNLYIPYLDRHLLPYRNPDTSKVNSIHILALACEMSDASLLRNDSDYNSTHEFVHETKSIANIFPEDRIIKFITVNPGQQVLASFHPIILDNPRSWYQLEEYFCLPDSIDDLTKKIETIVQMDHSSALGALQLFKETNKSVLFLHNDVTF